jgi:hypothetical protein
VNNQTFFDDQCKYDQRRWEDAVVGATGSNPGAG